MTLLFSGSVLASEFTSPNGIVETCQSASATGATFGIKYSKKDLKAEKELCKIDFHSKNLQHKKKGKLHSLAVCPKLKNTSPALEVFAVPVDMDRDDYIKTECGKKNKELGKKLAKYKVSTSCAHSPSILGYYHFSRLLNIGNVPVNVLRSVDREFHLAQAKLGVEYSKGFFGWLPKNWVFLVSKLERGTSLITTDESQKSYGALLKNAKGEELYREMYGSGVNGYTKHALAKQAKKRGDLTRLFSKSFSNLPKLFALKDYTDMLIIDAVLSQFDRYGNVDYYKYYYYQENGVLERKKYKEGKPEVEAEMKAKGAIVLKRILLKDNDCGVNFRNRTLDDKALKKVRHFSRESFERLGKLNELFKTEAFVSYLKDELLFRDKDVAKVKANTELVYNLIKSKVDSGKAALDLNPEDFK